MPTAAPLSAASDSPHRRASENALEGALVTVFGGGGFIGQYVVQDLLRCGARVRIASRNPEKGWPLKPLADLGQLQFAHCDITREDSLAASLHGATHVVNLAGAFGGDLDQLMGEAPGNMARIAAANGVQAMVHVSAIVPDAAAQTGYGAAKRLGEERIREALPQATILRPSITFAKDEGFLDMIASMVESMPVMPVFGADAKLQLVYIDDVADAITTALIQPEAHGGHIYELGGPEAISMMDLHQRIAKAQGRSRRFVAMPDGISALFAALPLTPMSRDQWGLLKAGSVVSGEQRSFADLDIEPRPLGLFLDKWMTRYRQFGRFGLQNEHAKERMG